MSIHIDANRNDIAQSVLLPGDPLRAKWIAETYLKDYKCYNNIRGMLGYTGFYKEKRISVQGTGMGAPSALIYCHELIKDYGVKNLIRVGTTGSYQKAIKIHDIVIAMAASTTSGINSSRFNNANYAPTANFDLLINATLYAKKNNIPIKPGNVLSVDEFYESNKNTFKTWAEYGVLSVDMETAAIYTIAAQFKARALSILTVSDSLITNERTTAVERETSFGTMVEIALNSF